MKPENLSETYVFIKCIAIRFNAIKHFSDSFFLVIRTVLSSDISQINNVLGKIGNFLSEWRVEIWSIILWGRREQWNQTGNILRNHKSSKLLYENKNEVLHHIVSRKHDKSGMYYNVCHKLTNSKMIFEMFHDQWKK